MAMSEKIKIVLLKRKMTVTSLAEMIGTTRSNLSNKLSRDNFSEKELKEMDAQKASEAEHALKAETKAETEANTKEH